MANPPPLPLREAQRSFTAYIRDPHAHPAPAGISERRMAVYHELFYNNLETFLVNYFPVLRAILGDTRWDQLVHEFFAHHRSHTPHFIEIPEEFLGYLQHERTVVADAPPFLVELAHYEWVELALLYSQQALPSAAPTDLAALLESVVVCSELAWPLAYQWPVHRICPDFCPLETTAQPTCLLVYRDADDQVRFMEINPLTLRLLQALRAAAGIDARAVLVGLAHELGVSEVEQFVQRGAELLADFAHRRVIGRAS